jgi:hypothetical protein
VRVKRGTERFVSVHTGVSGRLNVALVVQNLGSDVLVAGQVKVQEGEGLTWVQRGITGVAHTCARFV